MTNNKNQRRVLIGDIVTIILIVVLVACSATNKTNSLISGNTYYVSLTGSDLAACTATAPCRTYQRAEALASAGDTISFARNTYPAFTITKAVAVFGNGSLINSSTVNGITIASDNVTVNGFEVKNSLDFGIFTDKKNFVIEGNTVHETVKNNNNTATTCKNPASGWGSAIKVKVGGENGVIRNNTVYENCGEGIAVTRGVSVTVENNKVYDNYSVNIYVDNSQDVTVRNNTSYCTGKYQRNGANANAYSLGEEFYSGWGSRLDNIAVLNNSGRDCKRGIYVAESWDTASVYSNITISNNDFSTGQVRTISMDSTRHSNVLISNNIIFGNIWIAYPNGVTLLNNVFAGTPTWTMTPLSTLKPPSTTATRTAGAVTATRASTATMRPSATNTHVMGTDTPLVNYTNSPEPTLNPDNDIAPYPTAPLCLHGAAADLLHDRSIFHTLWNNDGCHYDHEHGTNPFTDEVAAVFPGIQEFLGGFQIGHTNLSSPMENTHKHGGFKWFVNLVAPHGCEVGFESGTVAISAYAIQLHMFGPQSIEFEARNHTASGVLEQCKAGNPSDKGYVYFIQLQEYGQRVMPYQGLVLNYPDNFLPTWDSPRGPYFTTECFGNDVTINGKFIDCRQTFGEQSNNLTVWTSKRTGPVSSPRPPVSSLFVQLSRSRDNYQRLDIRDLVHPFTWMSVCGGATYNPDGCKFNNASITLHEVMGNIPASLEAALGGLDQDARPGRITFTGYVTQFGALRRDCTAPRSATTEDAGCYPIKLVNAFVGVYSSDLCAVKCSNPNPIDTPSRNFFWCGSVLCAETAPGAVPSGWIMEGN